ncbi:hypothetical protein L1987_68944 [Smallanthus sonchifolius]|uniref:Uncharacterized protein n=1 Tax=Smallanthus sonchifolius TaxID=185202 RepID=A0ACB9B569_9ASTR|nr:hypothetical protein L1987_68944 [Smallanthus sonchifolius]
MLAGRPFFLSPATLTRSPATAANQFPSTPFLQSWSLARSKQKVVYKTESTHHGPNLFSSSSSSFVCVIDGVGEERVMEDDRVEISSSLATQLVGHILQFLSVLRLQFHLLWSLANLCLCVCFVFIFGLLKHELHNLKSPTL